MIANIFSWIANIFLGLQISLVKDTACDNYTYTKTESYMESFKNRFTSRVLVIITTDGDET